MVYADYSLEEQGERERQESSGMSQDGAGRRETPEMVRWVIEGQWALQGRWRWLFGKATPAGAKKYVARPINRIGSARSGKEGVALRLPRLRCSSIKYVAGRECVSKPPGGCGATQVGDIKRGTTQEGLPA